jgi:hypothetical protein
MLSSSTRVIGILREATARRWRGSHPTHALRRTVDRSKDLVQQGSALPALTERDQEPRRKIDQLMPTTRLGDSRGSTRSGEALASWTTSGGHWGRERAEHAGWDGALDRGAVASGMSFRHLGPRDAAPRFDGRFDVAGFPVRRPRGALSDPWSVGADASRLLAAASAR